MGLSVQEARKLLEKSGFAKMGSFVFITTEKVTKRGHRKYGAQAHCFKGNYHRHVFYVFKDNEIIFINEEDEDSLW